MLKKYKTYLLFLIMCVLTSNVYGLDCIMPEPLKDAEIIFKGKIVKAHQEPHIYDNDCTDIITYEVITSWHGTVRGKKFTVKSEVWECGGGNDISHTVGHIYNIALPEKGDKAYKAGLCDSFGFQEIVDGKTNPALVKRLEELKNK